MRTESSAHLWTQKAEAEGHTSCFMAEEFLADEKDCHKILTFLTYFLMDFWGSAKHILNWLASETKWPFSFVDRKDSRFKPVKGQEKMEFYFAREEETCFVLVVEFIEQHNSIIDLLMPFVLDPYICE